MSAIIRHLRDIGVSLLSVSVTIFLLTRLLGADVAQVMLGSQGNAQQLAALREELGLNQPLFSQYFRWIGDLITGDLGISQVSKQPLYHLIFDKLGTTLLLVIFALLISIISALFFGTIAALFPKSFVGKTIFVASRIGVSLPGFLVGFVLVAIFSLYLPLFPASGWADLSDGVINFLRRATLPAFTLSSVPTAVLNRYIRSALLDIRDEPFIKAAMLAGMTRSRAYIFEALPNIVISISTIFSLAFIDLLVGAVAIEQVFNIPGIGTFLLQSAANRDVLAIQNTVMVLATIIVIVNTLVTIFSNLFDTRLEVIKNV